MKQIWNRNPFWLPKIGAFVSATMLKLYPVLLSLSSLEERCSSVALAEQKP